MKKNVSEVKSLYFCRVYDFFSKYMHEQKSASPNTIYAYKVGLRAFGTYVEEVKVLPLKNFRFEDVTYDLVLDFRNYLHEVKKLTVSTSNNRLAANKTYMEYCAARDISLQSILFAVSEVPFYKIPKVHQPIIENKEALAALLSAPLNTDKGIRDKAILCFLYDGALRVDELVKLTVGDIGTSDEKTRLFVHGKGAKERVVVLDEKATAWSNQFRNVFHPAPDPLCPFFYTVVGGKKKPMTTRNVRSLVEKYANKVRADYNLPDQVSPHTLRRTRGTMLYRDGVPLEVIAKVFGHASVEVTRAHYAFASEDQMLEVARKQTHVIPEAVDNNAKEEEHLWPENVKELSKMLGF
jgi:site-specific recombinase XerD